MYADNFSRSRMTTNLIFLALMTVRPCPGNARRQSQSLSMSTDQSGRLLGKPAAESTANMGTDNMTIPVDMETNKDVGTVQPSASLSIEAHTPGPWTIYDDSDPLKIKIKGQNPRYGGAHVATVLGEANAALIVASLDMLSALLAVEADSVGIGGGENVITDKTRKLVAAAIAKAESAALITSPTGDR